MNESDELFLEVAYRLFIHVFRHVFFHAHMHVCIQKMKKQIFAVGIMMVASWHAYIYGTLMKEARHTPEGDAPHT